MDLGIVLVALLSAEMCHPSPFLFFLSLTFGDWTKALKKRKLTSTVYITLGDSEVLSLSFPSILKSSFWFFLFKASY